MEGEDPYIVRAKVFEREARSVGFAPARERLIEAAQRYRELAAQAARRSHEERSFRPPQG